MPAGDPRYGSAKPMKDAMVGNIKSSDKVNAHRELFLSELDFI